MSNTTNFFDEEFLKSMDSIVQELFCKKVGNWDDLSDYFEGISITAKVPEKEGMYVGMCNGIQIYMTKKECDLFNEPSGDNLEEFQGCELSKLPSYGFLKFDQQYKGKNLFFELIFRTYEDTPCKISEDDISGFDEFLF